MGVMINGEWHIVEPPQDENGFQHQASQVRHWITPDGSAGPAGDSGFAPEQDRYHLYVSVACPFAHRTLVIRKLKGLAPFVSASTVNPYKFEQGWSFEPDERSEPDPLHGLTYLHEIYAMSDSNYTGRVSVPVLWDKSSQRVVSNDSGDIMRMFNSAFDSHGARPCDFCPKAAIGEIDELNEQIYEAVNIGVYKAGFADTQAELDDATSALFACLDALEARLSERRFLLGAAQTETDWRLFTTLVRFDAVYHTLFKCNVRRLVDYPNLWAYTRDLFQTEGVADTVDIAHFKQHYFRSMLSLNPAGLVPAGPLVDFSEPHGRG